MALALTKLRFSLPYKAARTSALALLELVARREGMEIKKFCKPCQWGYSSVVERVLCMYEASGSIPDISKTFPTFFFLPFIDKVLPQKSRASKAHIFSSNSFSPFSLLASIKFCLKNHVLQRHTSSLPTHFLPSPFLPSINLININK